MLSKSCCLLVPTFLLATCTPTVQAELRILDPVVNLGKVRGGAPLTHQFHFVNDGPEAVGLLEVRTSCGCLSPRLTIGSLAAGARGVLPMFIRSLGQPAGPHTWTAQLRYRLGHKEMEAALQVSADIVNEITIQPASLVLFTSSELAQDILLTDSRPQPLVVQTVCSSSHGLKAELLRQEGGVIRLRVAATDAFSPGRHDETLTVYTNDPLYSHLMMPVTVVKEQRRGVRAIPETVTFRREQSGPIMVRLRGQPGEAIEVAKVEASEPAIGCRWAAGTDGWAMLRIQLDQSKLEVDKFNGRVTIFFRRPANECLVIPVEIGR